VIVKRQGPDPVAGRSDALLLLDVLDDDVGDDDEADAEDDFSGHGKCSG
jgi:hypothetical protein